MNFFENSEKLEVLFLIQGFTKIIDLKYFVLIGKFTEVREAVPHSSARMVVGRSYLQSRHVFRGENSDILFPCPIWLRLIFKKNYFCFRGTSPKGEDARKKRNFNKDKS